MTLHVERLGSGKSRLALLHGFTQTGRSWSRLATALAATHEVLLVDLPGHGDSGHADSSIDEAAALVGDTVGPATYVGYSMGGRIALHLAASRPGLVEALVLVGATAGIDDEGERAARRADDERLAQRVEAIGVDPFLDEWLAQPLFASLPADGAGLDDRRRNTVTGLAATLRRRGTGTQHPLWHRLSTLTMPVLVVAGEHDAKFRSLGHRLVATIGPTATLAVVPGAGHAAHLEAPDAFATLLTTWLASVPAAPRRPGPA